jgi:hypothetical protein
MIVIPDARSAIRNRFRHYAMSGRLRHPPPPCLHRFRVLPAQVAGSPGMTNHDDLVRHLDVQQAGPADAGFIQVAGSPGMTNHDDLVRHLDVQQAGPADAGFIPDEAQWIERGR